jgi:energy-coupling factor transporter ATP-binding protein EcfA2
MPTVATRDAIQTIGLTKRFGRTLALDQLDLTVEAGEVFGFLGPNGAGKSTTIRLLLGHLRPTAGEAWIFGHASGDAAAAHRHLAYVPADVASRAFPAERPSGTSLCGRGVGGRYMSDEHRTPGMTVHCQEIVELVTDYLEGVLDPHMTAEVEAHLELCDGCDIYVEQMRATIRALGKVPVETLSETAQDDLIRVFRDLRWPAAP